jgi:hypothetical protein
MMSWSVYHGSGSLLVLVNDNDMVATDVVMQLRGRAVGGMFGDPSWSQKVATMRPGDAVQAVFKAAWGAQADPPRIEISWTGRDNRQYEETVVLPI